MHQLSPIMSCQQSEPTCLCHCVAILPMLRWLLACRGPSRRRRRTHRPLGQFGVRRKPRPSCSSSFECISALRPRLESACSDLRLAPPKFNSEVGGVFVKSRSSSLHIPPNLDRVPVFRGFYKNVEAFRKRSQYTRSSKNKQNAVIHLSSSTSSI